MMMYGEWVEQELARYKRDLEALEAEYNEQIAQKLAQSEYLHRRANLLQCVKMLEELAEPVESDSA